MYAVCPVAHHGRRAFEEVDLAHKVVSVAASFGWQEEAPSVAISQDDEGDAGVEGVFEGLTDGVFGFAGLFALDEDGGFGGRMAGGEAESDETPLSFVAIGAALTGMAFRPDNGGVPAQFLKNAADDALVDGLFVGKPSLVLTGADVGECGFQGNKI